MWLTILTVWSINKVSTSINNNHAVTVSGMLDKPQQLFAIPIDKNTVWIIDANDYTYIKVITRDQEGFNISQSFMSLNKE
ncbi:hypothetical protein J2TS4_17190 [Paenibacillus sp. J2TS4]|nr:hypothetical protein J2TS4_17190 [Paenibacillus sp. J2TS4]